MEIAAKYNREVSSLGAGEILRFFLEKYPGKAAFSTSLGAEDQVLTGMLSSLGLPFRIFTLDTGRLFQETYDLLDITEKKYNLKIEVAFPEPAQITEMVGLKGINLFYDSVENRKLCCNVRKLEPMRKALQGMQVWITGMRRDQSVTRQDREIVEWDASFGILKVNPILDWTREQVWNYIRERKIPYNTLHDKGFPSIGCLPCTRAVMPGEDERAGRWWWESPKNKECGLHGRDKD
jgi:phosphoadenosine phosphosulfate reductase